MYDPLEPHDPRETIDPDEERFHLQELERAALRDGEIDPQRYSQENAGCLKASLAIFAGFMVLMTWLFDLMEMFGWIT